MISDDLLNILACPKCHAPVLHNGDTMQCTNKACALVYPIRDGVPIMLVAETVAVESETTSDQEHPRCT